MRPPQEVCFDLVLWARAGGAPLTLYQKDLADRIAHDSSGEFDSTRVPLMSTMPFDSRFQTV
jgi:hypothetical protein